MTAELATIDGEIIEEQTNAPVTLFGTTNPAAIVARATALATALADVIRQKRLFKHIGNHDHVYVEGWTLLGSMLGVFAEVEWSRVSGDGWEARAVARTLSGSVVGAAEAMCSRSESKWRGADDYAVRSMAQTRAVSKALRLPLGYIIELAGYSATPADEIPDDDSRQAQSAPQQASAQGPAAAPRNRGEAQQAIATAAHAKGWTIAKVDDLAREQGIKRGEATLEQLVTLLEAIESPARVPDAAQGSDPAPAPEQQPEREQTGLPATATMAAEPASGNGPQSPEVPVAADSEAGPSLQDVLDVTGGTLEPEKPEYVVKAEKMAERVAAEKAGRARKTAPDPEPLTTGLGS